MDSPRPSQQDAFVVEQVQRLLGQGLQPREIAVFARVGSHLESTPEDTGCRRYCLPNYSAEMTIQPSLTAFALARCTVPRVSEFKVVFAYDCSEGVVPHMATLRRCKDPADYDAARAREQQLLYVTLTRARDEVFITWAGLPSPFLPDKQ